MLRRHYEVSSRPRDEQPKSAGHCPVQDWRTRRRNVERPAFGCDPTVVAPTTIHERSLDGKAGAYPGSSEGPCREAVATTGAQRGARSQDSVTGRSCPKGFRARDVMVRDSTAATFKRNGRVSEIQSKLERTKVQFPVSNGFEIEDDCLCSEIRLVLSEAFEDRLGDAGVQEWNANSEQLVAVCYCMCCAFQLLVRIKKSARSGGYSLTSRVRKEPIAAIDIRCGILIEELAAKARVPVDDCGEERDDGALEQSKSQFGRNR